MKTCSKCTLPKEDSEFNKKGKGLQSKCKECNSKYLKTHYKDNKKYYRTKSSIRYNNNLTLVNKIKDAASCIKCGESHIACLDFHHKDPINKDNEISNGVKNGWSLKKLLKEIDKCDILCSNCHRKLHYEERKSISQNTSCFIPK